MMPLLRIGGMRMPQLSHLRTLFEDCRVVMLLILTHHSQHIPFTVNTKKEYSVSGNPRNEHFANCSNKSLFS